EPAAALQRLRRRPDQVVGITLGEHGVLLDDGSGAVHVAAFAVDAVDTTGAGDVFHGAYAFGVACGWKATHSASLAAAAAALACTGVGWVAIPDRARVDSLLSSAIG